LEFKGSATHEEGIVMKAIVVEKFGGVENVHMQDMPQPVPSDNEVLIKVAYAGVNPVDWKIREGYLKNMLPHEFPFIMGWDVSGTVVEAGKNVKNLRPGDEVYADARKPTVKWGTYSEYVTYDANNVAKKPKNISLKEAAALPIISLTAWQSLFDAIHLKKGETILIQGGSGGVGSMAIQFAKWVGAKVIATARPEKHSYIKNLGADAAIDYKGNVVEQVHTFAESGVDVVLDCVGGNAFSASLPCLKKGGRIVSILEHMDEKQAQNLGITATYVFIQPNGKQLTQIAELIEKGKIKPPHVEEMTLENASAAQEKLRSGKVLGKIVLKIA
jgi:NADPH:quinone reductase-like Zn-dependent oxidoreductase